MIGIAVLFMVFGVMPWALAIAAESAGRNSLALKWGFLGAAMWAVALGLGIAFVEQHRGGASP